MSEGTTLIHQHFEELVGIYPDLELYLDGPGYWAIRGALSFIATFNDITVTDTFSILIEIPSDYPKCQPSVQETGGRIPSDFHQYIDRTLCLGAPVEVERRFRAEPRLLPFVSNLVVPYLYGFVYVQKNGEFPFGELSHGSKGIREFYQDTFRTADLQIIFAMLKILAEKRYRGHLLCPCGSDKILRKCHGSTLLRLSKHHNEARFLHDATSIFCSMESEELKEFNCDVLPRALSGEIDEIKRNAARPMKNA